MHFLDLEILLYSTNNLIMKVKCTFFLNIVLLIFCNNGILIIKMPPLETVACCNVKIIINHN